MFTLTTLLFIIHVSVDSDDFCLQILCFKKEKKTFSKSVTGTQTILLVILLVTQFPINLLWCQTLTLLLLAHPTRHYKLSSLLQ